MALRCGIRYEPALKEFFIPSFGSDLRVDTRSREITCPRNPATPLLTGENGSLFRLAVPWYMAYAKDIPFSGKLVRPEDLPGGEIFARGTHVLPLRELADRFGTTTETFLEKGLRLGGSSAPYGDTAVELFPFPRLSLTVILWGEDEEFPARASLLFDSSAAFQAQVDILWAIAVMTTRMLIL